MRGLLVICLLGGCGRVGFDAQSPSTTDGSNGSALTLSYSRDHVAAVLGVTSVALAATVSDASATFTVAPALPNGLALDASSGAINGTPSENVDEKPYIVTATSPRGSATFAIVFTILPGYVVSTTLDAPDADNGADAMCATGTGQCSLRAAIQTTNNRTAKQLVLLDAAMYRLMSALPAITQDVMVAGAGMTTSVIRADTLHAPYAAFTIATADGLWLRDLEIRDFGGNNGGALAVTGGSLDVDRCTFTDNDSPGSGGVLFITNGASATFSRSMFVGNASLGGSGGGWGGVVDGEGTNTKIVVRQSAATQNTTAWGSFSHITTGTTLLLESSTLYGNTSTTAGTLATPGGIYTLLNATIVNNTNTSGTANSAGIYLYSVPCSYTVTNTLVAFNRDVTGNEYNCNRRDLGTAITSGGGNIFSDGAANCASYFNATGDRLSIDPLLDPDGAVDHGGLTPTVLVEAGSSAIDGGNDASCPAVDQRGVSRPRGAHCDVGAVELP